MAGLTKLDCDNERLWFVCQLCLCCECRATVSPWAISGFITAALCYVRAYVWEKLNCYVVKLIYYVFIIWCQDFFFLLPLAGCVFISLSAGFMVPQECAYANCDESFLILLPLTVKLVLTYLKWASLRYQHIPPQNPETMTHAYSFLIRMEAKSERTSKSAYLTWISAHIYISPCSRLAGWDFWPWENSKVKCVPPMSFHTLTLWTKKSLKC